MTMRRVSLALVGIGVLAGCGSPDLDPYCADYDDVTGRAVPLCRDVHDTPVCDDVGDTARFERLVGVVRLVGGHLARCDDERVMVCDEPSAMPYCLPELGD